MADAQDLSRIVNLIMQNPELIEQISHLAQPESEEKEEPPTEQVKEESVPVAASPRVSASRQELLLVMKPYLSDSCQGAIDSMITLTKLLDMMKSK